MNKKFYANKFVKIINNKFKILKISNRLLIKPKQIFKHTEHRNELVRNCTKRRHHKRCNP